MESNLKLVDPETRESILISSFLPTYLLGTGAAPSSGHVKKRCI